MARFVPKEGLDGIIAQRFGRPAIARVLDMLTDEAKSRAPACRVWVTMRDPLVRAAHVEADAQIIPDNLRFILPKADGSAGHDLARKPRDPNLPIANRINCRCSDPTLQNPLRDSIHATDVDVAGNRVSGSVQTRFPRAAESEFGTTEDDAAKFMQGALDEVAMRLRQGRSR